ncbi:winged helix-turn-helix transcriptional regulator [Cellulomonas sp. ICMP 17802]|uniref:winged helix-turn-helix transcriptional regulator n=1 Tax=Cellulomonas sp. ICMP 17802 TaxID=3239199 RepID=UPI00351B456E
MTQYGQFCPVAKAMELLDERWTMLIVRELIAGSHTFGDLQRGVPKMSPTLLSTRLRSLARAGVIDRHEQGTRVYYTLTQAGRELQSVVEAIGQWGIRWMPELGEEDFDPHLLMWDVQRNVDLEALPPGRTVLQFSFRDRPSGQRDWWLVCTQAEVDLCDFDPGHPVSGRIDTPLALFVRVWRGDVKWDQAFRSGELTVDGPTAVRRNLPRWLTRSDFAPVPRP